MKFATPANSSTTIRAGAEVRLLQCHQGMGRKPAMPNWQVVGQYSVLRSPRPCTNIVFPPTKTRTHIS